MSVARALARPRGSVRCSRFGRNRSRGGLAAAAREPARSSAPRGRGGTDEDGVQPAARSVRARAYAPQETGILRPHESFPEAKSRRERESAQVEARVVEVETLEALNEQLAAAGDSTLVVVEIESMEVCEASDTGEPLPEEFWRPTKEERMQPCGQLRHTLQRCARNCPDARFVSLDATSARGAEVAAALGVRKLPTLRFYRGGRLLWAHEGFTNSATELGQGVLYYGEGSADAVVTQLRDLADLDAFLARAEPGQLCVVDVSLTNDARCINMYPAVVSLAKAMRAKGAGQATFARLIGDRDESSREAMANLSVYAVPAFLFFRDGRKVGEYLGSSRADLLGKVLEMQGADGIFGSRMRT